MKILQVITRAQLRGAEIFASQLSKHLNDLDVKSDLLSLYEGNFTVFPNGLQVQSLERRSGQRLFDYSGWKALADIIKNGKYDIIQANAGDTLKYVVFSKLFFGWKGKIVFRNANKMGDFIDSKKKKFFNKMLISKIDFVISVSNLCKNDFIDLFKFPGSKITAVPIGIEDVEYSGAISEFDTASFSKKPVFINVGSFVPEKNQKTLIRMFSHIRKIYPDAQLLLVGEGRLKVECMSYANSLKLQESVSFLGNRSDVYTLLRNSDALLIPSRIEGLPGVILEAFFCRTPVIAYDVGGISEVVRTNDTGFLIKKDDEEHFLRAVESLLSDTQLRERMTNNAYKLVTSDYLNRSIAKQFLNIYNGLS